MDPVDRDVTFTPTKAPYDPRFMLAGRMNPDSPDVWESGFFDKESWQEIMEPWAQSVVVGRARYAIMTLHLLLLVIYKSNCEVIRSAFTCNEGNSF